MEAAALNPTGGVKVKPPVMLDYKKDPTRPGGGVFIAHGSKAGEFKDVPEGTVISGSSEEDAAGDSEGEVASLVATPAAGTSISLPAANYNDRARAYDLSSPSPFAPVALPSNSNANTNLNSNNRNGYMQPSSSSPAHHDVDMDYRNGRVGGWMMPVSAMRSATSVEPHNEQGIVASGSNAAPLVNLTPLNRGGHYANVNPAMNMQAQNTSGNVQVMNLLDGAQNGNNLASYQMADNGFLEGIPGGMFDWGVSFCFPFAQKVFADSYLGQWDTFFSRINPSGGFQQPAQQQQSERPPA